MRNLPSGRKSLFSVVTLSSLVTALLLPSVTLAQTVSVTQDDKNKNDDKSGQWNVSTIYVGDDAVFSNGDGQFFMGRNSTELRKKVSLEAENMPVVDALKKVLDQAGITYQIDTDVPTDKTVTVTLKNVPLSMVLNLLTDEAGVGWNYYRKVEGEKKESRIQIGKKRRQGFQTFISPRIAPVPAVPGVPPVPNADVHIQVGEAMRAAQDAVRQAQIYTPFILSGRMLDVRVKLDVHNSNVRDALKDVLKQADLNYALEDDVPDDVKRSFTFENVPISTALDVICRSADIGWTIQRSGVRSITATPGADRKSDKDRDKKNILILIGKKYAKRWNSLYGSLLPEVLEPVSALAPVAEDQEIILEAPAIAPLPSSPADLLDADTDEDS